MLRKFSIAFVFVLLFSLGVVFAADESVVIYSCMEDHRNAELHKQLKEKFPNMDVILQYMSTGNLAAKLKAEGTDTEADIVVALETGYLNDLKDILADHSKYDISKYVDGINPPDSKYVVWERYVAAIIVNTEILAKKKLTEPATYEDLTKPEYKDTFIMPDPKTSGTGYMFFYERVKTLGEERGFDYFDRLALNVRQFTASGSAPIKALAQGEIAVGLSLIFTAVSEINKGTPLKIIIPESGSPYSMSGLALIKGRETQDSVKKIFDFLYNDFLVYDKEYFSPEKILKEQNVKLPNFPTNVPYADMTGIDDSAKKEELLGKWKY